ncbi:MAG: zincin-like metallopeptidase domain-containing protein [Caldilineaceae bacterium]
MSTKPDIYTRITEKIVADLEQGDLTWLRPWHTEHPAGPVIRPLRATGQPYQGINILMLWLAALEHGFSAPIWLTYRQAQELGGQVRKGEQGSSIVYTRQITRQEVSEEGEETESDIFLHKGYIVFNVEQIDGLPDHFYAPGVSPLDPAARLEKAERFFAATRAEIRHGGNRAYYDSTQDIIQMPRFEAFQTPEGYAGTKAHELIHWTKHPSRLDRDFGRKRWGDEGYAMEELVAELGAAFLCADLQVMPQPDPNHAAYIASWLNVLNRDKRAIFTAASHAQRAAEHLHRCQIQEAAPSPQEDLPEAAEALQYVQGRLL